MHEAAVPAGPTGRNMLVEGLESTDNGDSFSCCSRHRGRRAKRGAPGAQRRNLRLVVCQYQALDKGVSPCGALWDRSRIHMECRPLLTSSQCVVWMCSWLSLWRLWPTSHRRAERSSPGPGVGPQLETPHLHHSASVASAKRGAPEAWPYAGLPSVRSVRFHGGS
eukprot:6338311-Alexandrium_andersonii.AAC.1